MTLLSATQPQRLPMVRSLDAKEPLPLDVSEITTAWLEKVLSIPIGKAEVREVMAGTATKIFVDLSYEDEDTPAKPRPKHVCIKGGFDPVLRELGMNSAYRREAEFFAHMASALAERNIPVPHSWFSGTDTVEGQGIVILDDLIVANCKFGLCLEPWTPSLVSTAVEQLAGFHAISWGAERRDYPWISEVPVIESVCQAMFSPEYWDPHFGGEFGPDVPAHMLDRERMYNAFKIMWRTQNPKLRCLIHGDGHLGNTYLSPAGKPGFLDYQAPQIGSAMHDVAYFVAGALTVEDRRAHEKSIVAHYLDALSAAGGPSLTLDDVWLDYRKHHLHGFVWPLTGPRMQTKDKVDAMSARHVAAIMDHGSIELLETLDVLKP